MVAALATILPEENQVLWEQAAQLTAAVTALQDELTQFTNGQQPPPIPPKRKCEIAPPEKFDGPPEKFSTFLAQCDLYMKLCPEDFPTGQVQLWFLISLHTGSKVALSFRVMQDL